MPIRATGSPADAAQKFVEKWSKAQLNERQASVEHFLDQPTPASADATGEEYTFEKHVKVVRSASKGSKGEHGFVEVLKDGPETDVGPSFRRPFQLRRHPILAFRLHRVTGNRIRGSICLPDQCLLGRA